MDEDLREQREEATPETADETLSEGGQETDTEGHSLLHAELHRDIATTRSREAGAWARGEAARKGTRRRDEKRR